MDELSPTLEDYIAERLRDNPSVTFEAIVTDAVRECVFRQDILRELA